MSERELAALRQVVQAAKRVALGARVLPETMVAPREYIVGYEDLKWLTATVCAADDAAQAECA